MNESEFRAYHDMGDGQRVAWLESQLVNMRDALRMFVRSVEDIAGMDGVPVEASEALNGLQTAMDNAETALWLVTNRF